MTQCVSDNDALATFARRQHDWMERVLKGSLDPSEVARAEQAPIDRGGKHLTIDYDLSLADMIALGRYDLVNGDITAKRFQIVGSGVATFPHKLFHFDSGVSSEEAARRIIADGWQPGKIEHILAYGTANLDDQRKFQIVALGTEALVGVVRHVAYLDGGGSERCLYLGWVGDGWRRRCRFLAVRN